MTEERADKLFGGPVITIDDDDQKYMHFEVKVPIQAFDLSEKSHKHLADIAVEQIYQEYIAQKIKNPGLSPKCHSELLSAPMYQVVYSYPCRSCDEETEVEDPVEFNTIWHYCGKSPLCIP